MRICAIFIPVAFFAVALAQEPTSPPQSYLQILSGVVPNPVDFVINGKLVFSGATAGQRITAIGIPDHKGEIVMIEKQTGKQLKMQFEFKKDSHNTLIVAGDFQLRDPRSSDAGFRLVYRFIENQYQAQSKFVTANILNGICDESVKVSAKDGKEQLVGPIDAVKLSGLPADLMLSAQAYGKKRTLYLGQQGIVRNLALVFFSTPAGMGFKAMAEVTPAATTEENKIAESSNEAQTVSQ